MMKELETWGDFVGVYRESCLRDFPRSTERYGVAEYVSPEVVGLDKSVYGE